MSITSLPSSPSQVSIDDLRVKLNEIIQAANDGTIGGGGFNFTLLENGDKILLEVGGGLLSETSESLDKITSENEIEIITE